MGKVLIKSEKKSLVEVVEFLGMLADQFKSRLLTLRQETDEVTVNLPSDLIIDYKLVEKSKNSGKKIKMQLEIKVEWFVDVQTEAVEWFLPFL
ncbi:MAG: amphi-Trp domain-containing protein [Candidatus Hodarchaeales archaeon]|jgi:amphi-Trp domain-containing protein